MFRLRGDPPQANVPSFTRAAHLESLLRLRRQRVEEIAGRRRERCGYMRSTIDVVDVLWPGVGVEREGAVIDLAPGTQAVRVRNDDMLLHLVVEIANLDVPLPLVEDLRDVQEANGAACEGEADGDRLLVGGLVVREHCASSRRNGELHVTVRIDPTTSPPPSSPRLPQAITSATTASAANPWAGLQEAR